MEHPGSRDLMDFISPAQWEKIGIPYSDKLSWERWGLFGVLADYVLRYIYGDIIEVGVCETSIYISFLAKKYNRKTYHNDIQPAVIENCQTVPGYFLPDAVLVKDSSDNFFKNTTFTSIALAFIDGDHTYEQVKKDFENVMPLMVPNGHIFLHDTLPLSDEYLPPHKCGDVYRFRQELDGRKDLDVFTFNHSAWSVGLTMVRVKPIGEPHYRQ